LFFDAFSIKVPTSTWNFPRSVQKFPLEPTIETAVLENYFANIPAVLMTRLISEKSVTL
jgi:hypothetical protein